jgi:hypothetical protein
MAVLQCQLLGVEGDPDDPAQGQRRDHAAGGGVDHGVEVALDDERARAGFEGQDLFVSVHDDRDAVRAEPDLLHGMKKPRFEGGVLGSCQGLRRAHRASLRQWSW